MYLVRNFLRFRTRNTRQPGLGFALAFIGAWFCGCSTAPLHSSNTVIIPPAPTIEKAVAIPATNEMVDVEILTQSPQPGSASWSRSTLVTVETNKWVSLEEMMGKIPAFKEARLHRRGPQEYSLTNRHGILILKNGSTFARWNGSEVWLGFPPQQIEGKLYLNRLDLEKSVLPLFSDNPVWTGRQPVIVIDPGHGGEQAGTRNIHNNRWEKEFTLDWALRLKSVMTGHGWKVFLTRTNDIEVTLSNRVAIAEAAQADLFVSLHFNSAFPKVENQGFETYCLTPTGMQSHLTRGYADDVREELPNNSFDALNLHYSIRLHQALLAATQGRDRGVRRARFMGVLRGQNRPAVLLEAGYLSNPFEARQIASEKYRQILAEAVGNALSAVHRPVLGSLSR